MLFYAPKNTFQAIHELIEEFTATQRALKIPEFPRESYEPLFSRNFALGGHISIDPDFEGNVVLGKIHSPGTLASHFSRHYSALESSARRRRRVISRKNRFGFIGEDPKCIIEWGVNIFSRAGPYRYRLRRAGTHVQPVEGRLTLSSAANEERIGTGLISATLLCSEKLKANSGYPEYNVPTYPHPNWSIVGFDAKGIPVNHGNLIMIIVQQSIPKAHIIGLPHGSIHKSQTLCEYTDDRGDKIGNMQATLDRTIFSILARVHGETPSPELYDIEVTLVHRFESREHQIEPYERNHRLTVYEVERSRSIPKYGWWQHVGLYSGPTLSPRLDPEIYGETNKSRLCRVYLYWFIMWLLCDHHGSGYSTN
ncbi:hypothetical protein B0J17DRAFT_734781 [Rhizoctonia solani]|nr:hypothetical protein B0J17DRAFT_734781 [Rhizoctonia solani]